MIENHDPALFVGSIGSMMKKIWNVYTWLYLIQFGVRSPQIFGVRKVEDSQPQRALWMRPPLPAPPVPAPAPADARPRRRGADSGRFVVDLMGKLYLSG
jgi:hypothetical protein